MAVEMSSSSDQSCPICLGSILQPSYLDRCFHKFCLKCILQWAKVVSRKLPVPASPIKCPLCKIENTSIIHKWDGNTFQRHYFNQNFEDSFILSKEHEFRLQCYYTDQDGAFNVSKYWKLRKYLQPCRWLDGWLKRELQALMQEEDVNIVMHHLLGVVISSLNSKEKKDLETPPETKQKEFEALVIEAAKPFLGGRSEKFVKEMELFLASGLNIKAYDEVYLHELGRGGPESAGQAAERGVVEMPLIPFLYGFDEDSE